MWLGFWRQVLLGKMGTPQLLIERCQGNSQLVKLWSDYLYQLELSWKFGPVEATKLSEIL